MLKAPSHRVKAEAKAQKDQRKKDKYQKKFSFSYDMNGHEVRT